jgi:hypothetical protein
VPSRQDGTLKRSPPSWSQCGLSALKAGPFLGCKLCDSASINGPEGIPDMHDEAYTAGRIELVLALDGS